MEPVFWSCIDHTHTEIQEHALEVLGYDNVKECIPFTLEEIKCALENGDEHLNTLDMRKWDAESGFVFHRHGDFESMYQIPSKLTSLYKKAGLKAWSSSQGVSLLKYVAVKEARKTA